MNLNYWGPFGKHSGLPPFDLIGTRIEDRPWEKESQRKYKELSTANVKIVPNLLNDPVVDMLDHGQCMFTKRCGAPQFNAQCGFASGPKQKNGFPAVAKVCQYMT